MVASIGLLENRILIFGLLKLSYFTSDFDRVCDRLHGLIRVFISELMLSMLLSPLRGLPFRMKKRYMNLII